METLKDRLLFLRKKYRYTQEDVAKKINVSDKVISRWETGVSEPSLEDLRNLSNFYNVSFDYLIEGKANESDQVLINKDLTLEQMADDFIKLCYKVVKNRNYAKLKDKLVPIKIYEFSKRKNCDVFVELRGGIFKCYNSHEWKKVYSPYIDLKKLLAFDDYDLYKAFIDLPATFGELRYQLKKNHNEEGLKATEPTSSGVDEWTREKPKAKLTADDIKGLLDYRFAKEIKSPKEARYALEQLDKKNANYWHWVKALIDNGAVLQKVVYYDPDNLCDITEDDITGTKELYEKAKSQIKKTKK